MALFVQLDSAWPDNPKVIRVGLAGAGLHAQAMCLAKRTETDGLIHRTQLYRLGADDELIDLLIIEGLFDAVKYGELSGEDPDLAYVIRIHDWHSRNPSQGEISASRSENGRRGNHIRYDHPGAFEDCPKCSQTNTAKDLVGVANLANGSQPDLANLANLAIDIVETEKSRTSERGASRAAADASFAEFWDLYPKKEDRKVALTRWRNMAAKDRDAALAALPAHVRTWQGTERRFVPKATTWLNGERWLNEIADAPRPKPQNGGVTMSRFA